MSIQSIVKWEYWDAILSCLVIIHLISEYWHYAWEYFSGRNKSNILKDIHKHRMSSTKTQRLKQLQKDVDCIKKCLGIKDDLKE